MTRPGRIDPEFAAGMPAGAFRPAFRTSLWHGIPRYVDVLFALSEREVKSRFAGDRLGYLWAFITPVVWIGILALSFHLIGRAVPIHTDVVTFLMTGMLPYIMLRSTISAVLRGNAAGRMIVVFGALKHTDVLLASALLEFCNALVLYALFCSVNYLLFGHFEMFHLPLALFGYSLAWGLGAAFGRLAAAAVRINDAFGRAVPVLLRPLFLLSGVFYTANELPERLAGVLAWNPLFHAIEIMRDGVFLSYTSRIANPMVPILSIVGLYLLSHLLERSARGSHGG